MHSIGAQANDGISSPADLQALSISSLTRALEQIQLGRNQPLKKRDVADSRDSRLKECAYQALSTAIAGIWEELGAWIEQHQETLGLCEINDLFKARSITNTSEVTSKLANISDARSFEDALAYLELRTFYTLRMFVRRSCAVWRNSLSEKAFQDIGKYLQNPYQSNRGLSRLPYREPEELILAGFQTALAINFTLLGSTPYLIFRAMEEGSCDEQLERRFLRVLGSPELLHKSGQDNLAYAKYFSLIHLGILIDIDSHLLPFSLKALDSHFELTCSGDKILLGVRQSMLTALKQDTKYLNLKGARLSCPANKALPWGKSPSVLEHFSDWCSRLANLYLWPQVAISRLAHWKD